MSYSWNYDYPQIARDSGFKLRQFEEGSVNWRAIGSVEVGRIVTEQNLEQVDCLLEYISEAPLVPILKSNVLESGLCKFFGLAQLGIQYLLFCKKFLDKTVAGMREALRDNQAENYKLKSQNDEINNEFLRLHQKLERLEEINKVLYPCSTCPKNFVSSEMLKTHIARKHPQSQSKSAEASDRTLINTIKLELEIKQLKERLNAAEKQIKQRSVSPKEETVPVSTPKIVVDETNEVKTTSVQTELITNDIGIQTNLSDDKDFDEILDSEVRRNEELLQEIRSKFSDIEKWKVQETEFSQKFMEAVMEKLQTLKTTGGNVSIEDIQPVVAKAIGSFDIAYMDKLNGIADKIEGSLKETFSDLHDELKQLSKTQENVQSTMGNLLKERNPHSPGNSIKEIAPQKGFQEVQRPLSYATHVELVEEDKNEFVLQASQSISMKESEKKSFVGHFEADVPLMHSLVTKGVGKVVPEQRTVQQKRAKGHKRYPKEEIKDINVSAQLNEKLADLGISPKANSLPDNVASRALQLMAKIHKSKDTPNFFRVRSRIKKVVEKLSRERASNEMEHTSEAPTTSDFPSRERLQESGSPESLDDFKLRLEKILNAPIEKVPKSPYSAPVASKPMHLQGDSVQKKPVPVPRKRVMFDLERTGMRSPPSDG